MIAMVLFAAIFNGSGAATLPSFPTRFLLFDPVLDFNKLDDRRIISIPFVIGDRYQDPIKPYPYRETLVNFENKTAGINLAGTLTSPFSGGPFPAVVLISGSGAQDRNEEILNHRPFLVLADYLTRHGIAILRYDDRGSFESTGDIMTATTEDFADDAYSGVQYLKTLPEIDPSRIGLIGHSEGGMIAPMLAAAHPEEIAFIVLMAGPGDPAKKVLLDQGDLIARASGYPEYEIQRMHSMKEKIIQIVLEEPDDAAAKKKIQAIVDQTYPELSRYDRLLLAQEFYVYLIPWMRYFLAFDPKDYLTKVKCPVLAINGSKDLQVPAASNLQTIEKFLIEGGNTQYEIKELPNLNHLFQTAKSGSPNEYESIAETLAPVVLDVIKDWIVKTAAKLDVYEWMIH
ncbi:MAG: alpha/beta hydrolase [Candidatus Omnitrophota bacterium]